MTLQQPPELTVAYLVNQYPKVSHTFIRREMAALEKNGIRIERYSIRQTREALVDPADREELKRTRAILSVGAAGLLTALIRTAVAHPAHFLRALLLAIQIGWCSDRGLMRHFAYLAEACVLLEWLSQRGIRHLHAHFGTNSATVAMLCNALGGPSYSLTIHGPEEFDKARTLALDRKIARAQFVVTVSEFGRHQLEKWCPASEWHKIHVIYPCLDETFLAEPLQPIPPAPRVVCVGRLHEHKGQTVLLQALSQLHSQGICWELALVGDGPQRKAIESLIRELGLQHSVTLVGAASSAEVRRQLLQARVIVLPSVSENLPCAILEALALGRPVISTMVAGISEVVEPGVCGWLVPPGSVDALVDALREAVCAPAFMLEQMGREGAERVTHSFDATIQAQRLARLLHSTCEAQAL